MIDALGESLRAAAHRSPYAYPLVFAAGLATSLGPCVAPRYVAVAALVHRSAHPGRVIAAFLAGLIGAYVALGLGAGVLGSLWSSSTAIYVLLAIALAAGGIVTLLRDHRDDHDHHRTCAVPSNAGGTFLLGASSAFVVSPCCTPAIAGIAGLTTLGGRTFEGCLLLATFALGHGAPLLAAGALGTRISALFARLAASEAPAVIAGTLMLALAAYYGTLA
ncbi:MAG TPA: cytochrome c biogenesis protein CcdA [Candidatus Acidoferrum sp.]|nr:cytochrome c biogenesis protein CcdA [Candidatus Acidoferrum sp.]